MVDLDCCRLCRSKNRLSYQVTPYTFKKDLIIYFMFYKVIVLNLNKMYSTYNSDSL